MYAVSWLLVVYVSTLFIVNSGSSPTCRIPDGHTEGELVRGPQGPQGGRRCQRLGTVEIVSRRCETRYCCGSECTCLGEIHTNSSVCSSNSTKLSCFVEHTEIREYEYICCNGYNENSEGICEDINECTGDNTCDQGCQNTAGDFQCYCGKGYQLATDGHTCNVDPTCNNMCDHNCSLVNGRYICTCRQHYVLGENGATCYPMTTCSQWNDCEQVCVDTEKGFQCSCRSGYRINLNGYTCDDINECYQNEEICQHECVNTVGSYRCYCDIGFRLNATDGRSCTVDSTCNGSCDHTCALVNGRYRCICDEGYALAENQMSCQYVGTTSSSNDRTTSEQPELSTTAQLSFSESTCNRSCDHACAFVNGRYLCVCNEDEGYVLANNQMSCQFVGTSKSSGDRTTSGVPLSLEVTTVTTSTASRPYTIPLLTLYMCSHALLFVFTH